MREDYRVPVPDIPLASDRGYSVVWLDDDDRETAALEAIADDVHRILGGVVRLLLKGDHPNFSEQDKTAAKQLIEPLLSTRKISLYSWRYDVNWTIQVLPEFLGTLSKEPNKNILDLAFPEAVNRIFPDVPYRERLDVEKLDFEAYREPEDVPLNWHLLLQQAMRGGNQARRPREGARTRSQPITIQPPTEDKLTFTNQGELAVYRALKEIQASLPQHKTIGIYPLPGARVLNKTFEPDMLITYKGRAGIIEIDGPKHRGRASDDRSRDRLFTNAGVLFVERLGVEDISNAEELNTFLRIFIERLAKQ